MMSHLSQPCLPMSRRREATCLLLPAWVVCKRTSPTRRARSARTANYRGPSVWRGLSVKIPYLEVCQKESGLIAHQADVNTLPLFFGSLCWVYFFYSFVAFSDLPDLIYLCLNYGFFFGRYLFKFLSTLCTKQDLSNPVSITDKCDVPLNGPILFSFIL